MVRVTGGFGVDILNNFQPANTSHDEDSCVLVFEGMFCQRALRSFSLSEFSDFELYWRFVFSCKPDLEI